MAFEITQIEQTSDSISLRKVDAAKGTPQSAILETRRRAGNMVMGE
jgi:hypothetical protein